MQKNNSLVVESLMTETGNLHCLKLLVMKDCRYLKDLYRVVHKNYY